MNFKKFAKDVLARADIRVERLSNHPSQSLLGLAREDVSAILDIGANIGQFAADALIRVPSAKIWCFEPLPSAYAQLQEMSKQTNGRMTAVNVALGSQEGTMEMHCHNEHSPSSSLMPTTATCEELFPQTRAQSLVPIQVRRLDDVFPELRAPVDNLVIKLDVQGFEAQVIEGGPRTFAQAKSLIVEINLEPLYVGAPSFDDLCALLGRTNHRFAGVIEQFTVPGGRALFLDALFRRS